MPAPVLPAGEDAIDMADPKVRRQIEQKRRLMDASRRSRDARPRARPREETGASPAPGNHVVRRWVVLDLGTRPSRDAYDPWDDGDEFAIVFGGLGRDGADERAVTLGELRAAAGGDWVDAPPCDWHCVTGWSALGLRFRGVPWETVTRLLDDDVPGAAAPRPDWRCLFQRSADGYTAGVHADDLQGAFLAVTDGDGEMITEGTRRAPPGVSATLRMEIRQVSREGRVRARIELREGFWERLGCHPRGRWATEERWAPGASARVWTLLAWITGLYRSFFGERVWEFVMVKGGRALGAFSRIFGTGGTRGRGTRRAARTTRGDSS